MDTPYENLKIQNCRMGAPKWPTVSGKGSTTRFWVPPSTSMNKFFDLSTLSMRKVENGEKTHVGAMPGSSFLGAFLKVA